MPANKINITPLLYIHVANKLLEEIDGMDYWCGVISSESELMYNWEFRGSIEIRWDVDMIGSGEKDSSPGWVNIRTYQFTLEDKEGNELDCDFSKNELEYYLS